MNKWNKFLTEGDSRTSGIVVCLNDEQQFLIIRRSDVDEREGQIEHDDWKWATIEDIKDIANTEIPIYLLEKALEISKNEDNS